VFHVGIAGAFDKGPRACAVACDGAVGFERDLNHVGTLVVLVVELVLVEDELVVASYFVFRVFASCCYAVVGEGFAIELEWCGTEPSALIDEELVNSVLESFVACVETSVIDEETTSLVVNKC